MNKNSCHSGQWILRSSLFVSATGIAIQNLNAAKTRVSKITNPCRPFFTLMQNCFFCCFTPSDYLFNSGNVVCHHSPNKTSQFTSCSCSSDICRFSFHFQVCNFTLKPIPAFISISNYSRIFFFLPFQ